MSDSDELSFAQYRYLDSLFIPILIRGEINARKDHPEVQERTCEFARLVRTYIEKDTEYKKYKEVEERLKNPPKCKNCGRSLDDTCYRRRPKSGGMLEAPGLCDICYNNWLNGLIIFDVFLLG